MEFQAIVHGHGEGFFIETWQPHIHKLPGFGAQADVEHEGFDLFIFLNDLLDLNNLRQRIDDEHLVFGVSFSDQI